MPLTITNPEEFLGLIEMRVAHVIRDEITWKERWLGYPEVAERYGVKPATLQGRDGWIAKGRIPQPTHIAGAVRWPLSLLEAWEDDGCPTPVDAWEKRYWWRRGQRSPSRQRAELKERMIEEAEKTVLERERQRRQEQKRKKKPKRNS